MRSTPGIDGEVIARVAEGTLVVVIDGAAQADGYTWWRVRGDWGEGWCAAEFLEPTALP